MQRAAPGLLGGHRKLPVAARKVSAPQERAPPPVPPPLTACRSPPCPPALANSRRLPTRCRLQLGLVCKQLYQATRVHGGRLWSNIVIPFSSAGTLHSWAAFCRRCACSPLVLMLQVGIHGGGRRQLGVAYSGSPSTQYLWVDATLCLLGRIDVDTTEQPLSVVPHPPVPLSATIHPVMPLNAAPRPPVLASAAHALHPSAPNTHRPPPPPLACSTATGRASRSSRSGRRWWRLRSWCCRL